jgi:aminoglycoside phosphotransferase (APT) family kinase protein
VHGIDVERVSAWLAAHVADAAPPFEFEVIAGGRSNLTYLVADAIGRLRVLRRPPLGHVLATAHDMAREHRILTAVGRTDVPVPRVLGLCDDPAVNGAPFYVMDHVPGLVLDAPAKAEVMEPAARRSASEHLVDVLADLHAGGRRRDRAG